MRLLFILGSVRLVVVVVLVDVVLVEVVLVVVLVVLVEAASLGPLVAARRNLGRQNFPLPINSSLQTQAPLSQIALGLQPSHFQMFSILW